MIDLKYKILLTVAPLAILLTSCATPDRERTGVNNNSAASNTLYELNEDYNLSVVDYTVKRGDLLSTIALEITGDANNWQEIAEFNSISNPRNLQTGTVLAIPTDLIVGYEGTTNVLSSQSEQANATPEAQSSSLAIRRNDVVEAPVIVTPINTNRDFELNPIDPNTAASTQNYKGAGTQVRVIGSYYPKGVYTEPASYSKLIFRATPGTLFLLDSKVNDWYKIETSSGSGYIRTSDAAIVK